MLYVTAQESDGFKACSESRFICRERSVSFAQCRNEAGESRSSGEQQCAAADGKRIVWSQPRRTREIGICMAPGALPRDVVAMMMREVLVLIGAGIAAGVPLALALSGLVVYGQSLEAVRGGREIAHVHGRPVQPMRRHSW